MISGLGQVKYKISLKHLPMLNKLLKEGGREEGNREEA